MCPSDAVAFCNVKPPEPAIVPFFINETEPDLAFALSRVYILVFIECMISHKKYHKM
jgi:hypothetical protein